MKRLDFLFHFRCLTSTFLQLKLKLLNIRWRPVRKKPTTKQDVASKFTQMKSLGKLTNIKNN